MTKNSIWNWWIRSGRQCRISLTTDIIVGFPGETEEDFQETMDVVRKVRYDSAFTFIYSKRTGTPAATMEDQVPEDVVKDRFDRLLNKDLEPHVAEIIAHEMKEWAIEKGATHYTHWFQPLTNITARSVIAFINPQKDGSLFLSQEKS